MLQIFKENFHFSAEMIMKLMEFWEGRWTRDGFVFFIINQKFNGFSNSKSIHCPPTPQNKIIKKINEKMA
jgi:hypothetical protein